MIELWDRTDEERCTILQLAVERNHLKIVNLILQAVESIVSAACSCSSMDVEPVIRTFMSIKSLSYKAMDKEHIDMFNSLTTAYEACKERVTRIGNKVDRYKMWLISAICHRQEESVISILKEEFYLEHPVQIKLVIDGLHPSKDIFSNSVLPSIRMKEDKILHEQAKLKVQRKALSLDGPGGTTTALHALIENMDRGGEIDVIGMMVNRAKCWSTAQNASDADFRSLFSIKDKSERTVLQLAVERDDVDAVTLILHEDPAYQRGGEKKRNDLMRLICKAIDNEYNPDIIKSLSETYKDGIIDHDPNHVLALILAIHKLDKESVLNLLEKAKTLAHTSSLPTAVFVLLGY
ncbi:hypothetical protein ACET3Z_032217 [Daucus carota]